MKSNGNPTRQRGTEPSQHKSVLAHALSYQEISKMKQMTNTFQTIFSSTLICLICLNTQTLSAQNKSKGPKSPLVIGIIKEAHDDHIVVITRDKYKRTLTFAEKSTVTYVGFDKKKREIEARFAIRAEVDNEVIQLILVTPPVSEDKIEPTPEMLKMTPADLLKTADLDQSGAVSYLEMSKTLFSSLKHGPVAFQKADEDRSGSLSLQELPLLLAKVKWWNMSRKTPEEWFKSSDRDQNGVLSQKELAVLLGSEAHLGVFFKRADKNTSGDLDVKEVSLFINELIFPSRRKLGRE